MKKGAIKKQDYYFPSYISLNNPRYVEIDNMYYSGLIIIDYNKENDDIIFKNIINENINIRMAIFYEKKDRYKTIKELTNNINNLSGKLEKEAEDTELVAYTKNDAKYIRSEMQINNEDLYNIYTYIIVFDEDLKKLKYDLNKAQGILESNGLITKLRKF